MITAARLEALMRHAATATRMIIDDGRPTLQGIDLHEMGDGSHRWAAFVHGLREDGTEYTARIVEPAPIDAPTWALWRHKEWEVSPDL